MGAYLYICFRITKKLQNMATVTFFARTNTKKPNSRINIRIRLRHGENYYYAKTPYNIQVDHWNAKSQQIKHKSDATYKDEINSELPRLETMILNEYYKTYNKELISSHWLQELVDKQFEEEKFENTRLISLLDFMRDFISRSENRINEKTGEKINHRTIQKYKTLYKVLEDFKNRKNQSLDFNSINLDFYHDFLSYLMNELNFSTNTIGKYISTLKVFLNEAKEQGYDIKISKRFKAISEESENIYLNESELEKLYKYDFSNNNRLERIRDLFIVGSSTGLRFSDFTAIKPENVKDDLIEIKQYKTKEKVVIPCHWMVDAILKKYSGNLPINISNQKFNDYIKEACKIAGIDEMVSKSITKGGVNRSKNYKKWELVSSHTARRSFATNLYKSGFPTISLMAITGHKTEKAFLTYIRVTPEEHAKKLKEHWQQNTKLRVV